MSDVQKIFTGAYVMAGLTPGLAGFAWWITGWAFLKGIAYAGLGVFIIMAVMYATADKDAFQREMDKLKKEADDSKTDQG